jgi:hypothetical protein
MMILGRVWYELFESEVRWLDRQTNSEYVELGRQVRLEMADGSFLYIAWNDLPGNDFYVDFGAASFCVGAAEVTREASASPLWLPLVGRPIELVYRDKERQVLEIRSGKSVVYCCSFGRGHWHADILHVAGRVPEPD